MTPLVFTENDILQAGVDEIIGQERLTEAFSRNEKLRVKFGIDPTSPNIHLGRSLPLWRLRAFQELGHEIHLIIGDFTGQIGDTSDKEAERPMLEEQKIKENLAHYLDQIWMILNPAKKELVRVHYNSQWLSRLSLAQIGRMADAFSVNTFVKRELVARRLEAGSRVSLREMLYPLMQGYDSIEVKADVELGGTDQRFNLLAGRILQEQAGQAPQAVIMNVLIRGTDGRKMSSSWGNVISLRASAEDKFGQVMACLDGVMGEYLLALPLCVRPFTPQELSDRLAAGENPRDLKKRLAWSITALYHGEEAADEEEGRFVQRFSEGEKPAEIPTVPRASLPAEPTVLDVLLAAKLVESRSEGRTVVAQGGVRLDDEVVTDPFRRMAAGQVLQKGKRWFVRLSEL